jgi:DNA-binding SARP family transcriptional activator
MDSRPVTPVTVGVLGPVRATLDGRPANVGGPRQRAVLARLVAAHANVVSTDRLQDDLWAGEPPPTALAALQVHVSHLRRALEPHRAPRQPATVIVSAPPGYALHLPKDAVDAWEFEALLTAASTAANDEERHALYTRAFGLWRGDAYAEVADRPWAAAEAARLDDLRLAAIEGLAAADLAFGRAARVVAALEPLLQTHPAREEAARLLALALYRSGRQGDALAVLRTVRRHLADELGIDPGPALRSLEADVLAQAPALDVPQRTTHVMAPTVEAPQRQADVTLGRDAELRALHESAATARRTSSARVVWISGEAGEGKSTLAEAAAAELKNQDWRVTWGRCPEVEGAPPGWAWHEAGQGLDLPDQPDGASPFLLARAISAHLTKIAQATPVVVVIEDAHRANSLTLQLLRQVVDGLDAAPVLLLVTYRASEAGADLTGARAAVAARSEHLPLRGLDRDAVAELAQAEGLDVQGHTLEVLAERTGGNPLFVRELARLLVARGPAAAHEQVPEGVADVLRARVARLPSPALTVLRQAAVLGRDVDVDVLADLAGRDPDELVDGLEAPVLAGLLDEPAPGRVRFTHALVRDTLYADTPLLRRTRLHARAVEVLEQRAPVEVEALAHHAMASLTPATAASALRYTRAAAEHASEAGAPPQAAALYKQALRAAGLVAPSDKQLAVELRVAAVTALAQAGDAVGGRALQREAVTLAGDDDAALVAVLSAWDAPLVWSVRATNETDDVLLPALRALLSAPRTDAVRARLLCALFLELENLDDAGADACSAEALALARRVGDPRLLCAALNARAYAALGPDLAAEREPLARELVEVAAGAGLAGYQAVGSWLVFLAAAARGDLVAAEEAVDRAVELAGPGQLTHLVGVLGVWRALLQILAGRVEEGLRRWTAATTRLGEMGGANSDLMTFVGQVVAAWHSGTLAALAVPLVAVSDATGGSVGAIAALALLDAGEVEQARAVYAQRGAVERGYYWLGLSTAAALAAARLGLVDDARRAYAELLPWAGRVAGLDSGTLALGPVDDALAACADLLGDTAAAARHRADADSVREQLRAQLAMLDL